MSSILKVTFLTKYEPNAYLLPNLKKQEKTQNDNVKGMSGRPPTVHNTAHALITF